MSQKKEYKIIIYIFKNIASQLDAPNIQTLKSEIMNSFIRKKGGNNNWTNTIKQTVILTMFIIGY